MTAPALSLFLNKDQTCDVDFGCYEDLDLEDLEKELTTILANVKRGRKAAAALQAIKSGKAPKNSHGQAGLDIFYEAAFSLRYSPKATVDLEEISLPAFMGMIELLSKQSLEALYDSPKALKEAASLLEKRPINPKVYTTLILPKYWQINAPPIRKLVASGRLRAWKVLLLCLQGRLHMCLATGK
ncbi:hypothetical protein ACEPPN_006473 [Leptodophora sp. 'Broadleaf-Isolate-01']